MAEYGSFAGGLAQGYQAGAGLALKKTEEAFNEGIRTKEADLQQQKFGLEQNEQTQRTAKDALAYTTQAKSDLARQIYFAGQGGDVNQLPALRQKLSDVHGVEQEAVKHLVGKNLQDHVLDAQNTIGDLESGRRKWSDISPEESTMVFSRLGVGQGSDFVDTADRPAPIGKKLEAFKAGVANQANDNGASLISATNDLLKDQFAGLVHQHAADGSTVVDVNLAPPVPHSQNPAVLAPSLHIKTVGPDGKPGEQVVPLMIDHGKILVDPDSRAQDLVQQYHVKDLFNHVNTVDALYQAVNANPEMKDKLMQGFVDGHEDKAAAFTDMIHILGHDPAEYVPKHQIVQMPDGSFKTLSAGAEYKESHDYGALADARVKAAQASADRAAAYAERGEHNKPQVVGQGTDAGGKPVGVMLDSSGKIQMVPLTGLAGPMTNPKANPKAAPKPQLVDEVGADGKKTGKKLQVVTDAQGNATVQPVTTKEDKPAGNQAVDDMRKRFKY